MNSDNTRKPGEAIFALILAALSLVALWQAYGISKFEALSAPGSFPMAVAAIMAISALVIAVKTLRAPAAGGGFIYGVVPPFAAMMALMLLIYAVALVPLGFLPTSLAFLTVSIMALHKRGFMRSFAISLISLVVIYIIFRLVFTVLMPEGIVPEREILAFFRNLMTGGAK